ncbi:MAG TPA: hypothetical protein VKV28_04630 [Candidatus Binataceae bacterium]|nr:hypothetical protein [Candidatus Binataceae bacterium]
MATIPAPPLRARAVLAQALRLDRADLRRRAEQARSPRFWRSLCPFLSVNADPKALIETGGYSTAYRTRLLRQFNAQGHFVARPLLASQALAAMRRGVETLKAAEWPPVFAFMYDEFWGFWQLPSLRALLEENLGPGYRMHPHVWCYYVHPRRGAKGWPPHADRYGGVGMTLWVALNPATLDNGCIYLVPKDLLPSDLDMKGLFDAAQLPAVAALHLMQAARPLPACAGAILGWDFGVLHWGAASHGARAPRISFSAEFVGPKAAPSDFSIPLLELTYRLPDFRTRLAIVAHNLTYFAANDPWTSPYAELGGYLQGQLSSG